MLPYQLEGQGYPLVLIHGWGVSYTVWHKLVPLLAPYFQLIMVELPGAGAKHEVTLDRPYYPACAEAIEELRIALGIEQWAMLAYSVGTRVGEAYLQRYPQRVSRAAFLCPILLRKHIKMPLPTLHRIDTRRTGLMNWLISGWRLYALIMALGFNLHRHKYAIDWMNEIALQSPQILKSAIFELPGYGRTPFRLPTTPSIPTLFIWGQRDALSASPRHPRPNDVIILANHVAPLLNPLHVAAIVLPFLQEEVALHITSRGNRAIANI